MATFAIDSAHTDVLFSAKHMMVTTVRGTFTDVSGTVEINEDRPDGVARRDRGQGSQPRHGLRRPRHAPSLRTTSSASRRIRRSGSCPRPSARSGATTIVVTADVTIRDVTRSVDFDVEFLGFFAGMDGSPARRVHRQGQGQPQGLGSRLERRARGRRLAGRRDGEARGRRRGRRSWPPSPSALPPDAARRLRRRRTDRACHRRGRGRTARPPGPHRSR